MKVIKYFLITLLFLIFGSVLSASAEQDLNLYFFYGDGCPHCAKEEIFLDEIEKENENIEIFRYEVWNDMDNAKLLADVAGRLNLKVSGVPILVIGDEAVTGFHSAESTGKNIKSIIDDKMREGCSDLVAPIIGLAPENECMHGCDHGDDECVHDCGCKADTAVQTEEKPETITIPLFGEINVVDVSMPALTIMIAALDGFNPCAMWVLLFLISLLLGMESKSKMWILGTVFILTSGIVYFLFLSAWLNLFLFIGFLKWVRIGIGLFAVWSGYYHLREYFKNKKGTCKVTDDEKRKKIFDRLKNVVMRDNFLMSLVGIMMLATAVNLVELLCSAGLPAVYTQVIAMSEIPLWQYYGYLVLYIFVFMLDDLLVFVIAMCTLRMKAISSRYTRWANLLGGIVMLIIGILMLFKPGWLMFG